VSESTIQTASLRGAEPERALPSPVLIDCRHLGRAGRIAAWQVGDTLVDPGPETSLSTVLAQLRRPVARVLVTHVHLDHAGAVGALVRRWRRIEVFVHESGAPHLADPRFLLASADEVYRGRAAELWGGAVPVPERNLRPLRGGETLEGDVEVVATPGHARHHVAYVADGVAYVGDAAGIRDARSSFVLMPTLPPDFDPRAWLRSLDALAARRPRRLALSHFGLLDGAPRRLEEARQSLLEWTRTGLGASCEQFVRELRDAIAAGGGSPLYEEDAPLEMLHRGIRESVQASRGARG
jgi:glyoxylase-like metal-dependent hydrolase (beta-lactamase superfamily II)